MKWQCKFNTFSTKTTSKETKFFPQIVCKYLQVTSISCILLKIILCFRKHIFWLAYQNLSVPQRYWERETRWDFLKYRKFCPSRSTAVSKSLDIPLDIQGQRHESVLNMLKIPPSTFVVLTNRQHPLYWWKEWRDHQNVTCLFVQMF